MGDREGAKIAPTALRKYRTFAKQLTGLVDSRGYAMLDQFTSSDIDVFYEGWSLGARARRGNTSELCARFSASA